MKQKGLFQPEYMLTGMRKLYNRRNNNSEFLYHDSRYRLVRKTLLLRTTTKLDRISPLRSNLCGLQLKPTVFMEPLVI